MDETIYEQTLVKDNMFKKHQRCNMKSSLMQQYTFKIISCFRLWSFLTNLLIVLGYVKKILT